jgi:hypothetical protein
MIALGSTPFFPGTATGAGNPEAWNAAAMTAFGSLEPAW